VALHFPFFDGRFDSRIQPEIRSFFTLFLESEKNEFEISFFANQNILISNFRFGK